MPIRERVPWWAVASSVVAPVALIGGWTLAAARQPPAYSSVRQTISALAALGAPDRWIMTAALAVLGACHLVTAAGLRPARAAGRVLLGLGGAATLLVAALPLPAAGPAEGHGLAAGVAFLALTVWPLAAYAPAPGILRAGAWAAGVLAVLLLVFFVELQGGQRIGLTERLVAGAQAGWPAVVAWRLFAR